MAPSELLESVLGVGYILCHLFHAGALPSMATKSLIVRMMAMTVSHVYCPFTFSGQLTDCQVVSDCVGNQNSPAPVLHMSRLEGKVVCFDLFV